MFINLDPNPRQTLRQFLGGVVDMLDKAPLDAFRYSARLTGIVKSNWKSGLDAASEGYHVQTLHRDSAKDMVCRSEEHTSELQSLMRISYAVFCLKKKKRQILILN